MSMHSGLFQPRINKVVPEVSRRCPGGVLHDTSRSLQKSNKGNIILYQCGFQAPGPSQGQKIREGTQYCGGHNLPSRSYLGSLMDFYFIFPPFLTPSLHCVKSYFATHNILSSQAQYPRRQDDIAYIHTLYIICISTVSFYLLLCTWYCIHFLPGCTVHVALPKGPINQFKLDQQSVKQDLRAYCPNIHTVHT